MKTKLSVYASIITLFSIFLLNFLLNNDGLFFSLLSGLNKIIVQIAKNSEFTSSIFVLMMNNKSLRISE